MSRAPLPCTLLALLLLGGAGAARAQRKPRPAPEASGGAAPDGGQKKGKSYTFTGLDIDGKLKTPQLLYFLNRMKAEFDSATPTHRSFMGELRRSPEDM